ncbi:MAG: hypothetical protein MUC63_09555 [Planctomycetes bacterium]|nr:hypothetical protein [Planctomycetota bacterium]
MRAARFTPEERKIVRACDTPEKVQAWLEGLTYRFDEKDESWGSFRTVVRDRAAHCFEGAVSAAAILSRHGYPPLLLCMEAADIDHNVFLYREKGKWGCVAKSRDPNLLGRKPVYRSLRQLVLSYYPHYFNYFTNDLKDLTLRGYAVVDLAAFDRDWALGESVAFLEEHLYAIPYTMLFPDRPTLYAEFPKVGKRRYLSPRK